MYSLEWVCTIKCGSAVQTSGSVQTEVGGGPVKNGSAMLRSGSVLSIVGLQNI